MCVQGKVQLRKPSIRSKGLQVADRSFVDVHGLLLDNKKTALPLGAQRGLILARSSHQMDITN